MNWLAEQMRKATQGQPSGAGDPGEPWAGMDGKQIAREVLAELERCGFLLAEVNGRRLVVSLSGIRDDEWMTEEQRRAFRVLGDMLAEALPEPVGPCEVCGAARFWILPDLTRRCADCGGAAQGDLIQEAGR